MLSSIKVCKPAPYAPGLALNTRKVLFAQRHQATALQPVNTLFRLPHASGFISSGSFNLATACTARSIRFICAGNASRKNPEQRSEHQSAPIKASSGMTSKPVTRRLAGSHTGCTPINAKACAISSPPVRIFDVLPIKLAPLANCHYLANSAQSPHLPMSNRRHAVGKARRGCRLKRNYDPLQDRVGSCWRPDGPAAIKRPASAECSAASSGPQRNKYGLAALKPGQSACRPGDRIQNTIKCRIDQFTREFIKPLFCMTIVAMRRVD